MLIVQNIYFILCHTENEFISKLVYHKGLPNMLTNEKHWPEKNADPYKSKQAFEKDWPRIIHKASQRFSIQSVFSYGTVN